MLCDCGSLDDISRPASSERKVSQDRPRSLEVLSPDVSDTQVVLASFYVSDEENEDPELLKAIRKMKRLDRILATKISNEKEVKKQGRELHQKLWQELEVILDANAENTRLFLALTSKVVVHTESSGSVEGGQEVRRDKQTDSRQTLNGKSKHRQDFVKKNIELAGGAGSLILMTQEEKERLDVLLKDLEEEEAHANVSLCTVPTTSGEGYTPQPHELDQLLHIDVRLQLLLPVENFLSLKSPYTDRSLTQVCAVVHSSEVCDFQEPFVH
uniref:Fibrous sheath-interacting protein 1 n=1 Tax=Pygocentrus nattereri TaxID=42514 RepID=A0AAR2IUS3_PYGNA